MFYTESDLTEGRIIKNFKGLEYRIQRVDIIKERKSLMLSSNKDSYSVWFDTGGCVIPYMDKLGYSIPMELPVLETNNSE